MLTVVKVSVAQGDVYARYLQGRTALSAVADYYRLGSWRGGGVRG